MGIPRKPVEPDPEAELWSIIERLEERIGAVERGAPLQNTSISGGQGLRVIDQESGTPRVQLFPNGTIVAFDGAGEPTVRMGAMIETGEVGDDYGLEVKVNGVWIQLGTQSVEWGNVGGKPATFTPSNHQHFGSDIVSQVPQAGYAATSGSADRANGPTQGAYDRVVAGVPGEWQAVYMHSNGTFGRGSSGEQYKRNIEPVRPEDPLLALQLQPVTYDRRAENADEFTPAVSTGELGLIAQDVEQLFPQLVTKHRGVTDNVRYEIAWLVLLPVVQNHEERIAELEKAELVRRVRELESTLENMTAAAATASKSSRK